MNETETRAELIDPALREAGWGVVEGSRVRREFPITNTHKPGVRNYSQIKADYVLEYKNQRLAVIEAKKRYLYYTEGLGQAKNYADLLNIRFTYATNGLKIYRVDMESGEEGDVAKYPTPDELWAMTYPKDNNWRDRLFEVPFETQGGKWQLRYYQSNAITKTLEAVADGQNRILLTLATGTGKTAIAFQIAWKLFHSKWNLRKDGLRSPRILFLADRNILADQAFNSFAAFDEDALVRISPSDIKKKGRVPRNGSIFFTIFQTFMSGPNDSPYFGEYPEDFFDFIIIDECHRGGRKDESSWRAIMDYFSPALHLGLTATPKRDINGDTYAYFGEPVYIYSLKGGINDGFLTPFKVLEIDSTIDEYVFDTDDDVEAGDVETGREYKEADFNRVIEIKEREAYRVKLFMDMINQDQKTLVFCATQLHAAAVRDLINQIKDSTHSDYCVRVTANDGAEGERQLRVFQDNDKTIPTILTTSQKLSTGVDARNIRNIVLMRPVNSMIEFKQIIGRGTRLFDGKDYFTVYDFVKAYEHFNDPEWDGEPEEPEPITPRPPREPGEPPEEPPEQPPRTEKIKIKLADGKERTIQHMMATTFWSPDGTPMSAAQFVEQLYGELPTFFKDEDQLKEIWGKPDTRAALMSELAEKGFGKEQIDEVKSIISADNSDIFDVLAYIAFASETQSRQERVEKRKSIIANKYDDKQQEFLDFVLAQYVSEGVGELAINKLPDLLELKYQSTRDAVAELGSASGIRNLFIGFQPDLYL